MGRAVGIELKGSLLVHLQAVEPGMTLQGGQQGQRHCRGDLRENPFPLWGLSLLLCNMG